MLKNNTDGFDAIETALFEALQKVVESYANLPTEYNNKRGTWITAKIKEQIGEVGALLGYAIASSIHGGEWLYDVVWYKNNSDNCLETVDLVLESESSTKEHALKYDFEKILISSAKYKVFVCFNEPNIDYPANVNRRIYFFEKSVNACKNLVSGEKVTVFIWDDWYTGYFIAHQITKQ